MREASRDATGAGLGFQRLAGQACVVARDDKFAFGDALGRVQTRLVFLKVCALFALSRVRAVRAVAAARDAMRRPSRVVGPAGARWSCQETRDVLSRWRIPESGKMRLKGKDVQVERNGDD